MTREVAPPPTLDRVRDLAGEGAADLAILEGIRLYARCDAGSPDRIALRRKRLRTTFATSVLVVFGLAGGALNYLWVNGGLGRPTEDRSIEAPATGSGSERVADDARLPDVPGAGGE